MTTEEYKTYVESGLFTDKELEHISTVGEITKEFEIILNLPLFLDNQIKDIYVVLCPIMRLETKITWADINAITFIDENNKLISEDLNKKLYQDLRNLTSYLSEDFKRLDYSYLNSSFEFLHVAETMQVQKGENLRMSVEKTLLSDDLKKRMEVALFSHELLSAKSNKKHYPKI